jgi:hypothetical protein
VSPTRATPGSAAAIISVAKQQTGRLARINASGRRQLTKKGYNIGEFGNALPLLNQEANGFSDPFMNCSSPLQQLKFMRIVSTLLTTVLVLAPGWGWSEPNAMMRLRICLVPAEAREAIAAHRLSEPFEAMRTAAAQMRAEAVGERLCRWNEQFIYVITLLRRDGRVIRLFVDAASGKTVGSSDDH